MKRGLSLFVLISFILISLVFVGLVNASFSVGNISHEIESIYAPGEVLRGWFNISLENEPADSLLTAFDDEINLLDFLNENNFEDGDDYFCVPNCDKGYSIIGGGASSKSINDVYPTEWLIGLKLDGQVSGITSFSFDVDTNIGESCINPIRIDIGEDKYFEWVANTDSDNTCSFPGSFGCFSTIESTDDTPIYDNYFCEQIDLFPSRSFKIGAVVNGSGDAVFEMTIETDDEEQNCQVSTNTSGMISCDIDLLDQLTNTTLAEVCIKKLSGAEYKIRFEDNSPCGSTKNVYDEVIGEHDYEIFARPKKYAAVSDFTFNQDSVDAYAETIDSEIILKDVIWGYIDKNYNGDCSNDCIVPIRFYFGASQLTTVSNVDLNYTKSGHLASDSTIYELEESSVVLNSGFLKLDLEKSNLSAPTDIGTDDLDLELNGEKIFSQKIQVKAIPQIIDLIPKSFPALVDFPISVILGGSSSNLTFRWDFGDEKTETTFSNIVKHAYAEPGPYTITVNVSNRFGSLIKSFSVVVGSPRDYINDTIINYRKDINNVQSSINTLPSWIKTEIEKKAGLEDLRASINAFETQYEEAFEYDDEENVKIMKGLLDLNVPSRLNISQTINPIDFFSNKEQFNLDILDFLGAGSAEKSKEDYSNAANNWIMLNLGVLLESKTYSFYFDGVEEPIFSYFKILLEPVDKIDEFYVVINGEPSKIIFNGEVSTKDFREEATSIIFIDLDEQNTIEFLYPGSVDATNLPIFISPEFKNLEFGIKTGICNFNDICEKELNEDYKNCRSDCKPVLWIGFYLIILGVVFLVVYIVLQEWYKRHYESKLFPDKNQLFNLINFMNNSLNQGIRKSAIFDSLKDLDWSGEQLNYAWRKFNGERTGMWEIPLFKWVEKRQVKREIAKRQNIPIQKKPPVQKRISKRIRRPKFGLRKFRHR